MWRRNGRLTSCTSRSTWDSGDGPGRRDLQLGCAARREGVEHCLGFLPVLHSTVEQRYSFFVHARPFAYRLGELHHVTRPLRVGPRCELRGQHAGRASSGDSQDGVFLSGPHVWRADHGTEGRQAGTVHRPSHVRHDDEYERSRPGGCFAQQHVHAPEVGFGEPLASMFRLARGRFARHRAWPSDIVALDARRPEQGPPRR